MPFIIDPRDTQSAIVGPMNTGLLEKRESVSDETPSVSDAFTAYSREYTLAGGAVQRHINFPDLESNYRPEGWDPLDDPMIRGYEHRAFELADAETPAQLRSRIARLHASEQNREVLARVGWSGPVAEITMTLLDPSFLVAIAVPELAGVKFSRVARALSAARQGVAGAAAYEVGMHAVQEHREFDTSLINVAAGGVLSGVLGSLGRHVPKDELHRVRTRLADELRAADGVPHGTPGQPSQVGAASVRPATTLDDETLAAGGKQLSAALSKTPLVRTDLDIVMNGDSLVARQVLQDLADVTPMLNKNLAGVRTADSIESAVGKHDARVADLVDLFYDQYSAYKKRVPSKARLSKDEFLEGVAEASRNSDYSAVPEVRKVAEFLRTRVFDPLYEDAKRLGIAKDWQKIRQQRLDEQTVSDFVGQETQRLYEDFIVRGAPGISDAASEAIAKFKRATREAHDFIPDSVINARLRKSVDEFAPGMINRFIARARAVAEGRARDADAAVNELADVFRKADRGELLGTVIPRQMVTARPPVVGAATYFRRMYDRETIRARRPEWDALLTQHFHETAPDAMPAEIVAAVEDVTRKILGADVGQSNWQTMITVEKAGPLKERVLDIPDDKIKAFLVNDPLKVARAYVRDLAGQVEVARRFHGDVEMRQVLQNIADEYDALRERVRTSSTLSDASRSAEIERLTKQEQTISEAIVRVRDRVLGRAGRVAPDAGENARRAVQAARGWRNLVASAKLGGVAMTGGTMDTARIAATYGFLPTMRKLGQLVASPAFRQLSYAQARRVGAAVEVALSKRVTAAYDGAITEGWTEKLANGVYRISGLNHVTDFNRTLTAALFEDAALNAAAKVKAGEALPKVERARLAALGLGDDELRRIADQVVQHGGELDGIRVSGSADWTDKALADVYDAAILKESKLVVQQPGAADRTWWLDKELGKFLGQLKTFALSSPSRLTTPALQMAAQGDYLRFARFAGFMLLGGYLTHALRQFAAGQQPSTDPLTIAGEAFVESGMGGILPDLASPVARRFSLFGESARFSDRNVFSIFGPAVGTMADSYDVVYNRTAKGLSARDLHLLRRLAPFQNVWWARRAINAIEGETAEALDLAGYETRTFGERFLETRPPLKSQERGGTGTGVLVQ